MFHRGGKKVNPSSPSSPSASRAPPNILPERIQHLAPHHRSALRRPHHPQQQQHDSKRNQCMKQVTIVGCSLLAGIYLATYAVEQFHSSTRPPYLNTGTRTMAITTSRTPLFSGVLGMMRHGSQKSRASSFPHQIYHDHVTNTVTAIRQDDLSMLGLDIDYLREDRIGNDPLVWNVGIKHDQNFHEVIDDQVNDESNSNGEEEEAEDEERNEDEESSEDEESCQYMHEWQKPGHFFTSCSQQHEIAINRGIELLSCGGDRCAFRLPKEASAEPVVLKMNKFHREIYDTSMNRALGDAKIMERLTKSHYVENIYSSCGMSQLLELGEGGCITDLVRAARKAGHDTMDPNDKLKILIQIVSAVADLHSFEDDGVVSVTHNDICCHQFVLIDGIYKLNDFHIATMSKKDKSNNVCKQGNHYNSLYQLLHAPEEASGEDTDREKDDVYMMGNVMYYVFTKQWLFEGKTVQDSINRMRNKKRSSIPSELDIKTIPANKAMHKALFMAWHHDPNTRPRARDIRDYLLRQLSKIEGKTITPDTIIRVSVPPIPDGFLNEDDDDFHDTD